MVMAVSDTQLMKAPQPSSVRDAGRVMEARAVQLRKAPKLMLVHELGSAIEMGRSSSRRQKHHNVREPDRQHDRGEGGAPLKGRRTNTRDANRNHNSRTLPADRVAHPLASLQPPRHLVEHLRVQKRLPPQQGTRCTIAIMRLSRGRPSAPPCTAAAPRGQVE